MKYHLEHDPMNAPKRARSKKHRKIVYDPQFLDDFGFADEVIAFDEHYERLQSALDPSVGPGPVDFSQAVFTKKSMGIKRSILLSATERRLGVTRKKDR